jgi:hypothetical protein
MNKVDWSLKVVCELSPIDFSNKSVVFVITMMHFELSFQIGVLELSHRTPFKSDAG